MVSAVAAWPAVALGEVMRQRKQFIQIDDTVEYKRCRVQLHAQGIVLRDIVTGAEVKTKSQQVCRPGEFLVAEIDAKVGGFGIVPPALDGAIVSSHYFLFVLDDSRLDQRFLDFYIRTPNFQEQVQAQGSTNYASVRPQEVLNYTIPLPSLGEQRRVVARIGELEAPITRARRLRHAAVMEAAALMPSVLNHTLSAGHFTVPIGDILERAQERTDIVPDASYRQVTVRLWGKGVVMRAEVLGADIASSKQYVIRPGQLILSRIDARNGAIGIVPPDMDGAVVSSDFPAFNIDSSRVTRAFVEWLVKSPSFVAQCRWASEGTTNRVRLKEDKFLRIPVPLPPLSVQTAVVDYLNAVKTSVTALKRLQEETSAELHALFPSVLDKAFRGEL